MILTENVCRCFRSMLADVLAAAAHFHDSISTASISVAEWANSMGVK